MKRALAAVAVALAAGCAPPATEAIVKISNADLNVTGDLDLIHIEVHAVDAAGPQLSSTDVKPCAPGERGDGCKAFPFTVLFVPGDRVETPAWVIVRALSGGAPVIDDAFVLAFVRGYSLRYDLVLYRVCKQSHCADRGEVCDATGQCAPLAASNPPDLAAPVDLANAEAGSDAGDDGPPPPRRIFLTTGAWFGNFGGRSGADAHCAQEATAAGLSGKFIALLGDSAKSPKQYVVLDGGPRPIVRTDGQVVATDATFWEATHMNLIDVGANGQPVPQTGNLTQNAWTGFDYTGGTIGGTCSDWTGSGSLTAFFGDPYGVAPPTSIGAWADYSAQGNCLSNLPCRLYCIEQ